MILSELIGRPVRDADGLVGYLTDVRFALDASTQLNHVGAARLEGLVVGQRRTANFHGYERTNATRPWLIAAFLAWRQRDTFLVRWPDVARLSPERIELRPGYRRHSAALSGSDGWSYP